jgi:thiol:disulfide interchange protein
MSKKHPARAAKPEPPAKQWPALAIIAVLVLLVGAILLLKGQPGDASDQGGNKILATTTLSAAGAKQATILPAPSATPAPTAPVLSESPEAQLGRLLAAGKPTLAFFHSNNCVQCIKMMQVVAQIYPEFEDSVALVDVNVYDKANARLLQVAGIRAIPTQIFYNSAGKGQVVLGAMEPEQFRAYLRSLAGGQ